MIATRLHGTALLGLVLATAVLAAPPVPLPPPRTEGGKPLMSALKARQSSREFDARRISPQVLSDLLWAGFGINRPDSGRRTAPSAMNWQEISIYVATADGLFLYDAGAHALQPVLAEDVRRLTGTQPFVKDAPVNLVYVADYEKMGNSPKIEQPAFAAADAAFISENVYLYCASEGLATVVRASIDVKTLEEKMKLPASQHVVFAQTVGYPSKSMK